MRNDKGQFIKGFPHNKGVKRDGVFKEMRRKMQREFHKRYGNINNNMQQIIEFLK